MNSTRCTENTVAKPADNNGISPLAVSIFLAWLALVAFVTLMYAPSLISSKEVAAGILLLTLAAGAVVGSLIGVLVLKSAYLAMFAATLVSGLGCASSFTLVAAMEGAAKTPFLREVVPVAWHVLNFHDNLFIAWGLFLISGLVTVFFSSGAIYNFRLNPP